MIRNGVGARLRLYRQLRNMTQESLSEVMGVTKQHLGQIERGQCNPSLDFLFKAAFALNTQVANFFLGNNHDSSGDCTQGCDEPARDVQPFAGCGLWTVAGPAGRDVWSPSLCRMLGYTSVRFPSLAKFSRHLTPGCTGIFKTFFDQAAAASSPLPVVVDLTRKDGVLRKVLAQAETLPDNSQGHTACIVFWDMTDWLETWRLFQQTRQELGETIRDRTAALTAAVADAKRELELRQEAERSARQAHALEEKAAEEQRILLNHIQTQTWYLIDAQTYGAVNEAHAAFNGLSIGDMAYRNIYEIFPRDVADICRQGNEKVFSTGLQLRSEEWVPHFSGERRLVSILKSPKLRADGTVEYVVCSGEDITEHRRFEEALKHAKEMAEEASRAKSGFLATMSHEIRTPINGIMGMLQLLQTANLNPDQAEFTDMAVRSCDRLVRLLSDIMDFSRIESGKLAIQAAPMSIESVFGQVRELFTPIVGNNGLALNFLLDPALSGPVIGDAFRLQQILNNLVDNACKFTPTGHITVQAWTMPGFCPGTVRVFFEVSDTGIGIPDAEQDRLFDPFIQVNESYVRSRRGVGLGLSICKRLVELMGGCMSLISEEGRGTSFAFSLPFGAGSDMACPKYVNDRQVASLAGRRVLLVEDDQVSAVAGVALLGRHGAEVTHARSGREALNALRAQTFDLVLMDVQMQDMDGTEVTRLIRAGKAGEQARNIPVIALTACAMAGDRERFIAAGMNNYVAKPMDIREMLKVAGQVMGATQDSARIK